MLVRWYTTVFHSLATALFADLSEQEKYCLHSERASIEKFNDLAPKVGLVQYCFHIMHRWVKNLNHEPP